MKRTVKVIFIICISTIVTSCDKKISQIKKFVPTYWLIMGMEKDGLNITRNISINTMTLQSDGYCHLPRLLGDGKLKLNEGEWKVEKVKENYCIIYNMSEEFLTDTFKVYFQTDTVNNAPSISMLMEGRRYKIWAIKQGQAPNKDEMLEMGKINEEEKK